MKLAIYHFLHVASMVFLTAVVFQAFANPNPKFKKRTAILAGILGLLMLVGGFGLLAVMKLGFPWWVMVKLVCWLGLVSISGLAYRKPEKIRLWIALASAFLVIGIAVVYFRHLIGG
ncbi:MAG: hypothetical protein ACFCUX_03445 [Candidatus Methylacidiphilales bacterium]